MFDGATPKIKSDAEIASFEAVLDVQLDNDLYDDGLVDACSIRPACVQAKLHGKCCPLSTGVDHPCCDKPVERQAGTAFRLRFSTGREWRIYTSSVVTWKWSSTGIVATDKFHGVVRVARVPVFDSTPTYTDWNATRAATAVLDAHAATYVTGGAVEIEPALETDEAQLRFVWNTATFRSVAARSLSLADSRNLSVVAPRSNAPGGAATSWSQAGDAGTGLLMLALPHHADQLEDEGESGAKLLEPEAAAAIPFWTLKGLMAPVVGATWVLHEDLTTIGFRAPAGVRNATMAAAILAQLQIDAKSSMRVHPDTGQLYMDPNGELEKGKADWMVNDPFWGNPYWNGERSAPRRGARLRERTPRDCRLPLPVPPPKTGKELARLALLAIIADELGDVSSRELSVSRLTDMLEPWLLGNNADPLMYDATWGGLCTADGLADHDADFGNGWYASRVARASPRAPRRARASPLRSRRRASLAASLPSPLLSPGGAGTTTTTSTTATSCTRPRSRASSTSRGSRATRTRSTRSCTTSRRRARARARRSRRRATRTGSTATRGRAASSTWGRPSRRSRAPRR